MMVAGLPEELILATINREYDPPRNKEDVLDCDVIYHDAPMHAHNVKNDEILACAAHRLRAQHGITKPADVIIYYGKRSEYERGQHAPDEMTDAV